MSNNINYLIHALRTILEFKVLLPGNTNHVETSFGKLAYTGIAYNDFILVLNKLQSKGIANFKKISHDGLGRWGNYGLLISDINWEKAKQYLEELESGKSEAISIKENKRRTSDIKEITSRTKKEQSKKIKKGNEINEKWHQKWWGQILIGIFVLVIGTIILGLLKILNL
ncbi:hypothetical protein MYX07_03195 [Patescibacteria group bacterium AH-259-L07]|nr:hypothetical protein [Patescibacteria group bacterium AH-259-L07]